MKVSRSLFLSAAAAPAAALLLAAASSASGQTLVARYEFADANNLGADSAGGDDNATNQGGVTQVAARSGAGGGAPTDAFAGSFDGIDDVLREDGGLTGYDGLPGVTFIAWVNNTTDGSFNGIISQDAGGCCNYRVLLDPSSNLYLNTGAHQDVGGAGAVPAGEWHHVALTVQDNGDGTRTAQVYVDGSPLGSPSPFTQSPGAPNASAFNTYIGAGEGGTAHLFSGLLDDVRVYDGVLTAGQVADVYNNVPEPTTLALGLAGFGLLGLRRRRR